MNSYKSLVRIKDKGQVTIPNEICMFLSIKKDDWLSG